MNKPNTLTDQKSLIYISQIPCLKADIGSIKTHNYIYMKVKLLSPEIIATTCGGNTLHESGLEHKSMHIVDPLKLFSKIHSTNFPKQ